MYNLRINQLNQCSITNQIVLLLNTASGSIIPYAKLIDVLKNVATIYSLSFTMLNDETINSEQVDNFFQQCLDKISQIHSSKTCILGWSFAGVLASYLIQSLKKESHNYIGISIDSIDLMQDILMRNSIPSTNEIQHSYLQEARFLMPTDQLTGTNNLAFENMDVFIEMMIKGKETDEAEAIAEYINACYNQYRINIKMIYEVTLTNNNRQMHHIVGNNHKSAISTHVSNNPIFKPLSINYVDANHFDILHHQQTIEFIEQILKKPYGLTKEVVQC